jgi:hypothetical protein
MTQRIPLYSESLALPKYAKKIGEPGMLDPNGFAQHAPGAKLDAGKVRPSLTIDGFRNALLEVSKVSTMGAAKYSDNGWKQVPDGIQRYTDAMYRHLLAEGVDEESGLSHLAHAAWNALAVLELTLTQEDADLSEETCTMVMVEDGELNIWWECSACTSSHEDSRKFQQNSHCPTCGAKIVDWEDME